MSQAVLIINRTKKEYLNPHRFNDGYSVRNLLCNGYTARALVLLLYRCSSNVLKEDGELIGSWAGDDIIIVGEGDKREAHDTQYSNIYAEADKTYDDISAKVLEILLNHSVYDEQAIMDTLGEYGYNRKMEHATGVEAECSTLYQDALTKMKTGDKHDGY